MTIGPFARAVGLSASALRGYNDAGLLVPAEIEERSGYRFYAPDQQQRAIWIRRLRDAGLGLSRINAILDADFDDAQLLLESWLADVEERYSAAAELVTDLKLSLRGRVEANPVQRTVARFDGAVLATAIEQVTAASGDDEFHGVLLDAGLDDVAVVATDRYRLLARVAVSTNIEGPPARVTLAPNPVTTWLRSRPQVELIVEAPIGRDGYSTVRAWFRDRADDVFEIECLPDRLPSVRDLVRAGSGAMTRAAFRRQEVLHLARSSTETVSFLACEDEAHLSSGTISIDGSADGRAARFELSATTLRRITEAAVGPTISCDVREPGHAVIWRAASQPDFVALTMPRFA
ncbi:MerR family transcriptional regulator [Microbacterium pseudoresistens]